MLLPDTSVWIALALPRHQFHQAARDWFSALKRGTHVGFCRATQQSFLRLLTTDAVMRHYDLPVMPNTAAIALLDALLANPHIVFAPEPLGVDTLWKTLASRNTPSPKLWMDAYLAAFALAGNHQLVTTDNAFSQFKDLRLLLLTPPQEP